MDPRFAEMTPEQRQAILGVADTEPNIPAISGEDTRVDDAVDLTSEAIPLDVQHGPPPEPSVAELAARTPVTGPAEGDAEPEAGTSLYIGEGDEEGVIASIPPAENFDSLGQTIDTMPVVDVPPEQRN